MVELCSSLGLAGPWDWEGGGRGVFAANLRLNEGTLKFGAGGDVLRITGSGTVDCDRSWSEDSGVSDILGRYNDCRFLGLATVGDAGTSRAVRTADMALPFGGEAGFAFGGGTAV